MNDYGSLRRRTRDAGWQWTLMGLILGLGLAMVVCVGAYAIGAISISAFDSQSDEPDTVIVPNETEVAMQAGLQQTVVAQQTTIEAQQALLDAAAAGLTGDATETEAATPLDAGEGVFDAQSAPEVLPSPLPGSEQSAGPPAESSQTEPPAGESAAPLQQAPEAPGGQGESQPPAAPAAEPMGSTPLPEQTAPGETFSALAAPQQAGAGLTEETTLQGTPFTGLASPTPGLGSDVDPRLLAIASELVPVNGGTFTMGTTTEEAAQAVDECALFGKQCDILWTQDSTPAHQVTLDPYQIEVTEVTTTQYVAFLNWMGPESHKNGCLGQPCVNTSLEQPETSYINYDGEQYSVKNPQFYSNHPVTQVTWWGAEAYCNAIGRRLPTEAEWEHAARGPDNYYYPWGFEFDPSRAMSSINETPGTVPVTQYPTGASPYGALNMAGNVEEWVQDWYSPSYYSEIATNPTLALNPQGPISGTERVLRGGSWDTIPIFLRSMHRRSHAPGEPTPSIGFRCVSDAPAQAPLTAPLAAPGGTGAESVPGGAPTLPASGSGTPIPTATLAPG